LFGGEVKLNHLKQIKFLVFDVDGTLTDSKIYMGDSGELMKSFDIKDGYGIKEILPKYGIVPVIITARKSKILQNRCRELGVVELHQGVRNKFSELEKVLSGFSKENGCSYTLKNVAYIGDDLLDIQCMKPIKEAGGVTACPQNAARQVIDAASFISTKTGGDGAAREFIEWLTGDGSDRDAVLQKIRDVSAVAYDFLVNFNVSLDIDGTYRLKDGVLSNVMTDITNDACFTHYESHRAHIDIQYILYGTEIIMVQPVERMKDMVLTPYNEESDVTIYDYHSGKAAILNPGDSIVFYPNDAHRGAISFHGPMKIRKIVFKVPIK
jgi:YrbI family 3-deoxy-D-manno-octulosonate 8-phosphate phosphatase/YhcH/YjgK/YiaL family protein